MRSKNAIRQKRHRDRKRLAQLLLEDLIQYQHDIGDLSRNETIIYSNFFNLKINYNPVTEYWKPTLLKGEKS